MVDVTKTNIPKDDSEKANGAADKAAPKRKAGRPKKVTTKEEPIRVSTLTKTFINKSRQNIHVGAFGLAPGEKRVVPNAVANALQQNDRTKLYLKNKSLEIK